MAYILLVEDNAEMRTLLQELLEWGGHQVACGRTGQEGLESLQQAPIPDLIISDLTMPGMDGATFLEQVRSNPQWAQIRFVLMSANPYDERLQTAQHHGLDGLLPKPFTLADLQSVLQ